VSVIGQTPDDNDAYIEFPLKGFPVMAKIVLIGLEQSDAGHICRALAVERHQVEQQSRDLPVRNLRDADLVFAGGEPAGYLPLLKRVREAQPTLPFVVVTRIAEMNEWLDALEAGATDYCSVPIQTRQIHWLMERALSRRPLPPVAAQ
jgi:DNA-binding NtrC family response regulator